MTWLGWTAEGGEINEGDHRIFMNGEPETKICPLCAETIKAAARVCPFCRSRQKWWTIWSYECFAGLTVVVFFAVLIAILWQFAPDDEEGGGRKFSGHRRDLVVLQPLLSQVASNEPVWVTGSVTNQGNYPWRIDRMEIRLLEPGGAVVDVQQSGVEDPFVVLPQQDHAFKVRLRELVSTGRPLAPEVTIQHATDGDLSFTSKNRP